MATDDLITVARARQAEALQDVDESYLAVLITTASVAICDRCKRKFVSQTHTDEMHNGDGTKELLLNHFPVASLTAVTIIMPDDTLVTVATTDFRIQNETGLIRFKPNASGQYTYFPTGFQNVKVTYPGGFAAVPEPIQQACVLMTIWLMTAVEADPNAQSEKLGDYAYTSAFATAAMKDTTLPSHVRLLLGKYMDHKV